jgi:cytochrome c551/c552
MKSVIVTMLATTSFVISANALATDMPDIAKKNGCTSCHAIDKKVVGPAWMDVSKKYQGIAKFKYSKKGSNAPDAKEYPLMQGLMMKVSKGGHGNWGSVDMTPNDPTSNKQPAIKSLVKFILGLAKK